MNETHENTINGELWTRFSSGTILPANSALSSLYLKYYTIDNTFYTDLQNNNIVRFDYFYDSIYIETKRGFIFDKLIFENNTYKPNNNDNHLIVLDENEYTQPDYWLDESNKKVYNVYTKIKEWTNNNLTININVQQFDIIKNGLFSKFNFDLIINTTNIYYSKKPIIEPVKISYNPDTKTFNISFIVRGEYNEFGLVSINLFKKQTLEIDEINCFLPYLKNKTIDTTILFNKVLETDFYN